MISTSSIVFYCPSELFCNETAILRCSIINVIWCLLTYHTVFTHKGSRLLHAWIYTNCSYILYCRFSNGKCPLPHSLLWGWTSIMFKISLALLSLLLFSWKVFFFFLTHHALNGASLVAQRLKHLPPMWETQVRSLGREDPLEKEMVNPLQYSCLENPMDGES